MVLQGIYVLQIKEDKRSWGVNGRTGVEFESDPFDPREVTWMKPGWRKWKEYQQSVSFFALRADGNTC